MNKNFYNAEEVADILGVSKGQAYKIIRILNEELQAKGYIIITGKIPKRYLMERCYCFETA